MMKEDKNHDLANIVAMSLHCISFLRNIFGEECYADLRLPVSSKKSSSKSTFTIKVLRSGCSSKVDEFISWIDHGVKKAIESDEIKALQLEIYKTASYDSPLLECFVFHLNRRVIIKQASNEAQQETEMEKNITSFMRKLIMQIQRFDTAPQGRAVAIRLLLRESTKSDLNESGFKEDVVFKTPGIPTGGITMFNTSDICIGEEVLKSQILQADKDSHVQDMKLKPLSVMKNSTLSYWYSQELKNPVIFPDYPSVLPLDDFMSSNKEGTMATQLLTQTEKKDSFKGLSCECNSSKKRFKGSSIVVCHLCSREIHSCCYGITSSDLIRKCSSIFKCYTCLLQTSPLDSKLILLMRLRYVWRYFLYSQIPGDLNFFFDTFNLDRDSGCYEVRKILNKLFRDKILQTEYEITPTISARRRAGRRNMLITLRGIFDDKGNELMRNAKYDVIFSPRVERATLFSDLEKKNVYFPNLFLTKNLVTNILEEFTRSTDIPDKSSTANRNLLDSSSYVPVSQSSSPPKPSKCKNFSPHYISAKREASEYNRSTNPMNLDELSFEESLNFLSQPRSNTLDPSQTNLSSELSLE
ncbi:Piso0_004792 [Millerozyma farinosa CBS 7064]|uniref:Piso0_004792 protein n=1 Tax=Pichia sorbitophila (strain ATCC MYA-4447 / BCRC 22081 / CBS 7064 / NBRC 10061 / NRRL Y-12695) TaxID=559304 RepID=G8Y0F6_PICSO|nr:Piso0_004792 [Millerozyma farinosa CBS 7064]